jgi:hypothetical protein
MNPASKTKHRWNRQNCHQYGHISGNNSRGIIIIIIIISSLAFHQSKIIFFLFLRLKFHTDEKEGRYINCLIYSSL